MGQHLAQPHRVGLDHAGGVGRHLQHQRQAFRLRLGARSIGEVGGELAQGERLRVEPEPPRSQVNEVEEIVEHRLQVDPRGGDHVQHLALGEAEIGGAQQLAHADDPVERRAQLMAHVCEELVLGAAGRAGLLDGGLETRIGLGELGGALGDAALQLAVGEAHLLLGAFAGDLGLDPGQGHGEVDRLGEIVVGAKVQRLDDVLALGLGRGHDHRESRRGVVEPDAPEHVTPVHIPHHHVEQHEVERLARDQGEAGFAAVGLHDLIAAALQTTGEDRPVVRNVVHDEDAWRRSTAGIRDVGGLIGRRVHPFNSRLRSSREHRASFRVRVATILAPCPTDA